MLVIGRRFYSTRNDRQGFTLIEVLLTLTLLVIIVTMAWPVLEKPIATERLRKAADEIRARWYGARVEAMDSGRTYVFRYAVAGNRFRIECYTSAETLEDPVYDDYFDGAAGGSGYTGALPKPLDGTLPAGITFVAGQGEAGTSTTSLDSDATSSYAMEEDWSEPIFFYPDGTTSTAVLLLQNQYNRCIELSLRWLTGTVDIGEVYAAEGPLP